MSGRARTRATRRRVGSGTAGDPFVAPELADRALAVDVPGATAILEDAGYELVDGVLQDEEGTPVTFTLTNPSGWTDYMWELEAVKEAAEEILGNGDDDETDRDDDDDDDAGAEEGQDEGEDGGA